LGPIRTLLVDDNKAFLEFLENYLNSISDLNIQTIGKAANGEDAVRMCSELKPLLVLMDLNMPRMNGLEATTAIRSGRYRPRIIILTGYDIEEYRRAVREVGADAFVAKPDMFGLLASIVREWFATGSPDGEPI